MCVSYAMEEGMRWRYQVISHHFRCVRIMPYQVCRKTHQRIGAYHTVLVSDQWECGSSWVSYIYHSVSHGAYRVCVIPYHARPYHGHIVISQWARDIYMIRRDTSTIYTARYMSSYHVYSQVYVFVSCWDIFYDTNLLDIRDILWYIYDIRHDMISCQTKKTNLTDKEDGPAAQ